MERNTSVKREQLMMKIVLVILITIATMISILIEL